MLTAHFRPAFFSTPARPSPALTAPRLLLGWLLTFVAAPLALLAGVFLFTLAAAAPLALLLGW